jgi:YidC/Oxa1 family membrane protein insertase
LEHAYGASIILFTVFVRAALFPINYKQLVSAEMTKSLSPKIQEIKEKYAGNKDLQNQMTVLLYQEANVS